MYEALGLNPSTGRKKNKEKAFHKLENTYLIKNMYPDYVKSSYS
jgi:hypothetical protein